MGEGKSFNIIPLLGNLPSPDIGGNNDSRENRTENDDQNPRQPKANGRQLFDKKWNDAQAAQRRNNLTTLVSNSEPLSKNETLKNNQALPNNETFPNAENSFSPNDKTGFIPKGETALFLNSDNTSTLNNNNNLLSNNALLNNNSLPIFRGGSILPQQPGQTDTLINQSWQDLINLASQNQNFDKFQNQSPEFWDNVVKMSELRTVETYINGQLEPRVTSRYGELLEVLNRQGGAAQIESFLNYLPSGEKEVFLARYQISQTFGANELFVGRGIAPDKSGHFPLEVFLSANGKNPQVPVNTLVGFLGGNAVFTVANGKGIPLFEQANFVANYQFLFNPKTAALLSLSLAFYQNVNAMLSLDELTPAAFLQKTTSEFVIPPNQSRLNSKTTFGKSETENQTAPKRASDEILVGGALINGALRTIEKYRKNRYSTFGSPADFDGDSFRFGFAAGATGAMMGATVGCVAPLAVKSVGEILGFASSVVVGLTDAGLRLLGANALVALITSGVQSFLDASSIDRKSLSEAVPNKFLNGAESFENDLRRNIFYRPELVSE